MKRRTQKKLLKLFNEKRWSKKPNLTWDEIGQLIDLSGEAARSAYRRSKEAEDIETKAPMLATKAPNGSAKILIFDIETAPLAGHFWRLWKQNIAPSQLLHSGNYYMLSWSAKWLFQDGTIHDRLTSKEALAQDDSRIVNSIWKLLDEADMVVAHWGSGFDVPMLNGRFIMTGLHAPSSYVLIDTKNHASKAFKFPSNKLDYIAQQLGVGQKIKTDWELWEGCIKGDEDSLRLMDEYCQQDVEILHDVYFIMRPYIKPHPNVGLYIESDVEVCPTCGSHELEENGKYYTTMNVYTEMRCKSCGSSCRSRSSVTGKDTKARLTSSLPK